MPHKDHAGASSARVAEDLSGASDRSGLAPTVTCVVVNWNGWQDTIACIASLRESEYPNLSVILVDNGSTDGSVTMIRSAHPWVEIIESAANLGFGGGNNLGIRVAIERGARYLWLLNNDTVVQPQTLTALVRTAEGDPELGQVGSVLLYAHAPDRVQAWGGGSINLWAGTSRHHHQPVPAGELDYLTAASVLIPAKVLNQVGLFDEGYFMYWEDADLSFRIRAAGWKLGVAAEGTLLHKEGGSNNSKSARMEHFISVSGIRFMRKFGVVPAIPIFSLIVGRAGKRAVLLQWRRAWAVLSALFG